jgi:hypothetical protein
VPAGQAERGDRELGQDVQPQVVGVEAELAREAVDRLAGDPGAVVLDVPEQGRLAGDQAAGGEEALVPAGVEACDRRRPGRGGVVLTGGYAAANPLAQKSQISSALSE